MKTVYITLRTALIIPDSAVVRNYGSSEWNGFIELADGKEISLRAQLYWTEHPTLEGQDLATAEQDPLGIRVEGLERTVEQSE